jgi:hypothetical protein
MLCEPWHLSLDECRPCLQAGTSVYILTLAFVTSILPSGFGEIAAIVGVIGCVTGTQCIQLPAKTNEDLLRVCVDLMMTMHVSG